MQQLSKDKSISNNNTTGNSISVQNNTANPFYNPQNPKYTSRLFEGTYNNNSFP